MNSAGMGDQAYRARARRALSPSVGADHPVGELQHPRLLADRQLVVAGAARVARIEPVDLDGPTAGLEALDVALDRSGRRARVVAALDDQDGSRDVVDVGE